MQTEKEKIERGSGNVFADLGRPDAEAHLLKAELVTRIDRIIRQRRLKQVPKRQRCWDCLSLTYRVSCAGTFANTPSSGSCAC